MLRGIQTLIADKGYISTELERLEDAGGDTGDGAAAVSVRGRVDL